MIGAFLTATSTFVGPATAVPLCAQETPIAVATDLLDEALKKEPVVTPTTDPTRTRPTSLVWWFALSACLSAMFLLRSRVRSDGSTETNGGRPSARGGGPPQRRDELAKRRHEKSAATHLAPDETQALQAMMRQALARAAQEQRSHLRLVPDDPEEAEPTATPPPVPAPPQARLDIVVPRYDPRSG